MSLSCYLLMVVNHLSVISAGTKLSPTSNKSLEHVQCTFFPRISTIICYNHDCIIVVFFQNVYAPLGSLSR